MSIADSAVLVTLSIGTWSARKLDKHKTEEVNAQNNADSRAANLTKNLMVGTGLVKQVVDYAAACRLENTRWTLPWANDGERCLPTKLVLPYKTEFNKRKDEFYRLRDRVVDNYYSLQQTAANYLGDFYNPDDYPDVDTVWGKYEWRQTWKPIPTSGHLYVDLPAQELDEMRRSVDETTAAAARESARHNWQTMYKLLSAMSEKLAQANDETKKTRFHDAFVDNAVDLCRMLEHFNLTQDPELERARRMLEDTIRGADITVIKESLMVREDMKAKVDNIINQFDW